MLFITGIKADPSTIDYSIKVLYPIEEKRRSRFKNEWDFLMEYKQKFSHPMEYGVVDLIDFGVAKWQYDNKKQIGMCAIVVYTYGQPIYPILMECVKTNNAKLVVLYFAFMVRRSNFISCVF